MYLYGCLAMFRPAPYSTCYFWLWTYRDLRREMPCVLGVRVYQALWRQALSLEESDSAFVEETLATLPPDLASESDKSDMHRLRADVNSAVHLVIRI